MCKKIVVFMMLAVSLTADIYAAGNFDKDDGPAKPKLSGIALRRFNWLNTKDPDWDFVALVENFVINIKFEDISKGPGDNDWTAIDTVLAFADKAKQHGVNLHFKLRITNGIFAPQWMKEKYGQFLLPIKNYEDQGWGKGADPNCVKWWDEGYLDAWDQFMREVAERYDNNDYINEIVISGTAVGTAEPLCLALANSGEGAQRRDAYLAAGCTDEKMKKALYRSVDAMKVFKRTNIGIALNPYVHLGNSVHPDNDEAKKLGEYICHLFGSRAVLGNNGLRTDEAPGPKGKAWAPGGAMYDLENFYVEMHNKYGSGIYNQTASTKQMGGLQMWTAALDNGLSFHSSLVELPSPEIQTKKQLTTDQLKHYKEAYKKNE